MGPNKNVQSPPRDPMLGHQKLRCCGAHPTFRSSSGASGASWVGRKMKTKVEQTLKGASLLASQFSGSSRLFSGLLFSGVGWGMLRLGVDAFTAIWQYGARQWKIKSLCGARGEPKVRMEMKARFFSNIMSSEAAHHLCPRLIAAAWVSHVHLSSAALWEQGWPLLGTHHQQRSNHHKQQPRHEHHQDLPQPHQHHPHRHSYPHHHSYGRHGHRPCRHRPIITTFSTSNAWWWIRTHPQKYEKHHFYQNMSCIYQNRMNRMWERGKESQFTSKKCSARSNLTKISPEKTCLLPNIEAEEISINIIKIYLSWNKEIILHHFHWLVFSKSGCIYLIETQSSHVKP